MWLFVPFLTLFSFSKIFKITEMPQNLSGDKLLTYSFILFNKNKVRKNRKIFWFWGPLILKILENFATFWVDRKTWKISSMFARFWISNKLSLKIYSESLKTTGYLLRIFIFA